MEGQRRVVGTGWTETAETVWISSSTSADSISAICSPQKTTTKKSPCWSLTLTFMVSHKKCLWCLQWGARSELIRQLLTSFPENTAQWGCCSQGSISVSVKMKLIYFVEYEQKNLQSKSCKVLFPAFCLWLAVS